jgi:hypothetical protein
MSYKRKLKEYRAMRHEEDIFFQTLLRPTTTGKPKHKDSYVVVRKHSHVKGAKKANLKNRKNYPTAKTKEENHKWKDAPPQPEKEIKYEDQNLGTHDMKGKFIKKRRGYRIWSHNPETPGRNAYQYQGRVK